MKKKAKTALIISSIVLAVVVGAFTIYISDDLDATPNALTYMESTDNVEVVQTKHYVAFEPIFNLETTTGILFFQGGKVDHRAYAPMLRDIASQNILTVSVISPFKLAMFSQGRPDEVIAAYPNIQHWIVMGHSLGGAFGSLYAYDNDALDGVILLASYVTKDFSTSNQSFLSVTASNDQVLDEGKLVDSYVLLPSNTTFVEIAGGNHGQFGDYGPQSGDGEATITPEEQRNLVVTEVTDWINTNFI